MMNNSSESSTSQLDQSYLSEEHPTFKAIKLILYSVIFLVSVIGNTLVCVVVVRRHRMRTVTNYYILNLAIADLTVTCICIPFDIPVQENNYKWPYGHFVCKILYPLQTTSMFASIFTLTAVSLNRFWAIVCPLKRQMSKTHAVMVIILVWVLSALLTIPLTLVLRLDASGSCGELWPERGIRRSYTAVLFVFQYMLPLTVITLAYIKIGQELHKSIIDKGAETALRHAHQKETRKVVRMLIVVTLLFAVCVLPNNIMWMWLDFGRGEEYLHFQKVLAVTNILLFANSAANPVAYTICHENFREEFKRYMNCSGIVSFSKLTSTFRISSSRIVGTSARQQSSCRSAGYRSVGEIRVKVTRV